MLRRLFVWLFGDGGKTCGPLGSNWLYAELTERKGDKDETGKNRPA